MDTRGQSIGIARYILGLVVGAIVFWIIGMIADPLLAGASESSDSEMAAQGTEWMSMSAEYYIVFVLVASFIGIIVHSIYVREAAR